MVEATGVYVPSGDFPFSVVGRWPRAEESESHPGAWSRVRSIEIGELPVGESLEAVGVVARVNVLPVVAPPRLMLKAAVPRKVPGEVGAVLASGSSNVVKEPSRWRTKPWNTKFESREYPAITPRGLMLPATVPIVVNPTGAGASNDVMVPLARRTKP